MQYGHIIILETPRGKELVKHRVILSHNTFGARYWTDGKCEGPMYVESTPFLKHPATNEIFWINDCKEIDTEHADAYKTGPFKSVPFAEKLTLSDYSVHLGDHNWGIFINQNRELIFRRYFWLKLNDFYRTDRNGLTIHQQRKQRKQIVDDILSYSTDKNIEENYFSEVLNKINKEIGEFESVNIEIVIENYKALLKLYNKDEPIQRLMIGEIYRNLGEFDLSRTFLKFHFQEGLSKIAAVILEQNMKENKIVCEVKQVFLPQ